MTRVVEARPRGVEAHEAVGGSIQDYAARIARYVPAEVLAAYLVLLPIVMATSQGTLRRILLAVILIALGVLNIPYLISQASRDNQPAVKQIIVSTAAYLVWTYSIGGLWTDLGLYQEAVAAILLVVVSIVGGFVVPYQGEK